MTNRPAPALPIRIEVGRPMFVGAGTALDDVRSAVELDVQRLMRTRGVPGRPVVDAAWAVDTQPVAMWVDGRRIQVTSESVWMARATAAGSASVEVGPSPELDRDHALTAVSAAIITALSFRAGSLLTSAAAADYMSALAPPAGGSLTEVESCLVAVLDMGRSIADVRAVGRIVGQPWDDEVVLAELVCEELSTGRFEVEVHPTLVNRLATLDPDRGRLLFDALRESVYTAHGLRLPDFSLREVSTLPTDGYRFAMERIVTLPTIALPPESLLVQCDVEELSTLGIAGVPTLAPNQRPSSLVDRAERASLDEVGLTSWDWLEHLGLHLRQAASWTASALLDTRSADRLILDLGLYFPSLEALIREHFDVPRLTSSLRQLVEEGVSIRNLARILELMLEHRTADHEEPQVDIVTFVRSGIGRQIVRDAAPYWDTCVVYLLNAALEDALVSQETEAEDRLLDALRSELAHLPAHVLRPAVLAPDRVRSRVSRAIRHEFPSLAVLGHSDLPLDSVIQPVARLGAD